MASVLVTGGAGFIGSYVVDSLVALRHRVTVVDDLSAGRRENIPDGVELVKEDIRSPRMKDVWRDFRPQYVFHLAAQKSLQASVENPVFDADVNITGSLNVLEQSRRFGVKKFIFSSTAGVYSPTVKTPTPETAATSPVSPYGIAKRTIEEYLRFFQLRFELNCISLRYSNVYGPRQDARGEAGVVAIFAERLRAGEPVTINGSGRQTRDYIHVQDVARANILAMMNPKAVGEVNISTGQQTSVLTLLSTMKHISGQRVKVKHVRSLEADVQKSALSWNQAKKVMKWQPEVRLHDGLQQTLVWAEGVRP